LYADIAMKLWLFTLVLLALSINLTNAQDNADIEEDFEDDTVDDLANDGDEAKEELKLPEERPVYKTPEVKGEAYFVETFDTDVIGTKWILSEAKKDDTDEDIAKYNGKWAVEEEDFSPLEGDQSLVLKTRARHHAIAAALDKPYEFKGKPFVVQYEVKFTNGQDCGGAYIKLLTKTPNLKLDQFKDKTGYTIMFGPDKCGNDDKLHFIFRHKNPKTGEYEEKHAKKPSGSISTAFTDKKTHLYTLVVMPDNSYEIYLDQNMVNSGSLLSDMTPPVNPPKEIVDPDDKKPESWDEREKIPDPDATKPDDWDEEAPEQIEDVDAVKPTGWLDDENELIPDPDAEKPEDWDDDMDGEWEPPMINNPACEAAPGCGEWSPPMIKNPAYKGKWKAPMIDNPNYQGKWTPRNIPNPDFFEDTEPYKMSTIGAIGLELWSMSDGIMFDNFLITNSKDVADQFAADSWEIKHAQEMMSSSSGRSVVDAVMDATKDRPWLWAVFIFVVVLPIILIIAYCCMSGPSQPVPKPGTAAYAKKTDAPTPDDVADEKKEEEKEEADEEDSNASQSGAGDAPPEKSPSKATKKKGKAALEAENAADDDADEEEEEAEAPSTPSRSSPRKRKTRARKD
jgi:calnexin